MQTESKKTFNVSRTRIDKRDGKTSEECKECDCTGSTALALSPENSNERERIIVMMQRPQQAGRRRDGCCRRRADSLNGQDSDQERSGAIRSDQGRVAVLAVVEP